MAQLIIGSPLTQKIPFVAHVGRNGEAWADKLIQLVEFEPVAVILSTAATQHCEHKTVTIRSKKCPRRIRELSFHHVVIFISFYTEPVILDVSDCKTQPVINDMLVVVFAESGGSYSEHKQALAPPLEPQD